MDSYRGEWGERLRYLIKIPRFMSTISTSAATALQLITSLDSALLVIVGRSLAVSATACLIACGFGLVLGAWLGVARFAGREVVLTGLNTLLAQALLVLPVVTALTRQAVEDAENTHGEQLRSLGASPLMRSLLLAWDERYAPSRC